MHNKRGLLIPFQRDRQRDLASTTGAALLRSKAMQVLATEGTTARSCGELPWRTNFGAGLGQLRHQRNDRVLAELAKIRARDALRRWLPDARLTRLEVEHRGSALLICLRFREAAVEAGVEVGL